MCATPLAICIGRRWHLKKSIHKRCVITTKCTSFSKEFPMSKKVMAFVIVAVSVVMSATFSPSSDGKEQRGKRLIPDAWIDGDAIGDSHRVDDDIKVKAKIQRYDSEVAASHAYEAYVLCYD